MITSFTPAQDLFDLIQKDFSMPLKGRFVVVPETEMYRWKEDESLWKQKKELSPNVYQCFFDGEFVCFFDRSEDQAVVYHRALKGMTDLYKAKKIFFNKEMYAIEEEKRKAQTKAKEEAFKQIEATTPEEKMIKEAFTRARKKKHV
jgi:hypothetical protein